MASKSPYLSGGRGRGHNSQKRTGYAIGNLIIDRKAENKKSKMDTKPIAATNIKNIAEKRIQRVHEVQRARHVDSNTEMDNDTPVEHEQDPHQEQILENIIKSYKKGSSDLDLAQMQETLSECLQMSSLTCIICLELIGRPDPTWSCNRCYCIFHLQCIQMWARDGLAQQQLKLSPALFPDLEVNWCCPKCRKEYPKSATPQKYYCFCKKQLDPAVDSWVLPHSCGDVCGRRLLPECGHECLLLCHPGPCPPCPVTVMVTCYCGNSFPVSRRCGAKGWACTRICRKLLACGNHICELTCHSGKCPPCSLEIEQSCLCGKLSQLRSCNEPTWSCGQICGNPLPCGNHTCSRSCHSGFCGDCPREGTRHCPCGKTSHVLPCTEDVPVCGDTCNKMLTCGVHQCSRSCHYGDCGQCLQLSVRKCRCGRKERELRCGVEVLCEIKCTNQRSCGRHQCRRKCCDGNCPTCENTCGRPLKCGRHKCAATCHSGPCYPCTLTEDVSCPCGSTVLTVPCGRKHNTLPPQCRAMCRKPPTCHHKERKPHRCHSGRCPPCKQLCNKPLPCGHNCYLPCHSEPQRPPMRRPAGLAPWEKFDPAEQSLVVKPCPPCKHPVSRQCKGGHEISDMPCCEAHSYDCGRRCGRQLACGNHTCQRGCHVVINPPDDTLVQWYTGDDCLECELPCEKPRPSGCTHSCPLPCHKGDCPPCEVLLKEKCYCMTMHLYIKCCEWTGANKEQQQNLLSCTSQCTKKLTCGHRCPQQCHPGECPSADKCHRKVTVRCSCRRIKKEFRCSEATEVSCDAECTRILQEQEQKREDEAKAQKAAEEMKEKEKAEYLQMMLQGRKKKKRKRRETIEEEEDTSWLKQNWKIILFVLLLVIFAIALIFYIFTLLS